MPRSILVPLDGSQVSERSLPWAELLAKRLDLPVTLVRIVPWPEIPISEFGGYLSPEVYDDVLRADRETAESYLTTKQAELAATGLTVTTVVRDGMAPQGIHDIADETGAAVVVMASHGRGGMARLVLGSVAERLLHDATIPIMLVRADKPLNEPSFQRVLVPLDGSPLAERALSDAVELLGSGATLLPLRIAEPIYDVISSDNGALIVDEQATQAAIAEARAYQARIAESLTGRVVKAETLLYQGHAAPEILKAAEEHQADAIVMTTHGRTGTARWLAGSVADEVFRNAHLPVLLISARTAVARISGDFKIRDLMTRDVEVIQENEPVISALRKLLRRRVSGAPVTTATGELAGVISEEDLLTWHRETVDRLVRDASELDPAAYRHRIESDTVSRLVSHPPIVIDETADMDAAIRLLADHGIRRLPVVSEGRLVGIISRADILKAMASRCAEAADGSGAESPSDASLTTT